MSIKAEIIEAAARAVYVQAWANYMEESGGHIEHGIDLMDQAPKTPTVATKWARELVKTMEKFNKRKIERIYIAAAKEPGRHEKEATPEDFGHYTAMESLGHGVGWGDSHPNHGFRVPSSEFYCDDEKSCSGHVSQRPEIGHDG